MCLVAHNPILVIPIYGMEIILLLLKYFMISDIIITIINFSSCGLTREQDSIIIVFTFLQQLVLFLQLIHKKVCLAAWDTQHVMLTPHCLAEQQSIWMMIKREILKLTNNVKLM